MMEDVIYSPSKGTTGSSFLSFMGAKRPSEKSSRIIDRSRGFHQSNGTMSIRRKITRKQRRVLYSGDWFHSLIDASTLKIVILLTGGYMLLTMLFALVYYKISITWMYCNLDVKNYREAFAFSLETMATIGYSTKDIFFGDCWLPLAFVAIQVCVKLVADALVIGVIYCRLARPHSRACTLIFSDKAVIRRIRGRLYFMFQVCELRKHQLAEAHIRLYLIRKDADLYHNNFGEGKSSDCKYSDVSYQQSCFPVFESDEEADRLSNRASDKSGLNRMEMGESCEDDNDVQLQRFDNSLGSSRTINSQTFENYEKDALHSHYQICSMRLSHPNDELGSMLLLCLPQMIVHQIDAWSPMMPPTVWLSRETGKVHRWNPEAYCNARKREDGSESHKGDIWRDVSPNGSSRTQKPSDKQSDRVHRRNNVRYHPERLSAINFPGVFQRSATVNSFVDDEEYGNGDFAHVQLGSKIVSPGLVDFMAVNEGLYRHKNHRNSYDEDDLVNGCKAPMETPSQRTERLMLEHFMRDRCMEIVAVLEGVDSLSGGMVQARHSYTHNDVEWNKSFAPCVFEDGEDGAAVVDFTRFHHLVDADGDTPFAGYMPSHI